MGMGSRPGLSLLLSRGLAQAGILKYFHSSCKSPHFPGKAKGYSSFMNGGPSHADTLIQRRPSKNITETAPSRKFKTERKTGAALQITFAFREAREKRN